MTGVTANSPSVAARASGSSFYLAMRILPRDQRQAMFEIYSFCRAVDDVADGDAPRAEKRDQLAQWRRTIDALYDGQAIAGLDGLAQAIKQFALRKDDFLAVIDGMEMDAVEDIRAPALETLDLYCDRVASAVGRLSVRVFGLEEADGVKLAHHLGRALQLTNILRDIDEDAGIGRLYLRQRPGHGHCRVEHRRGLRGGCRPRPPALCRRRRRDGALRAAHRARAAHHERGLSPGAGGHGYARLDLAAPSCASQPFSLDKGRTAACLHLIPARSTSSARDWRDWPPPYG